MKVLRTNSCENSLYSEIKELHYFKAIMNRIQFSIIKDFLAESIHILDLSPGQHIQFDHQKYVYVPSTQQNATTHPFQIRTGYQVNSQKSCYLAEHHQRFFMIEVQLCNILQKMYFLQMPLVLKLKEVSKIHFYMSCDIKAYSFNTLIYHKGDQISGFYYLISGQVRISRTANQKITQLALIKQNNFIGLYEIKQQKLRRELTATSLQNKTQLLFIPLKLIAKICLELEITQEEYLSQIKSEIYAIFKRKQELKNKAKINFNNTSRSQGAVKVKQFNLKIEEFQGSESSARNEVMNHFFKTKRLLYKIQELADKSSRKTQSMFFSAQNQQKVISQLQNSNQIWLKSKSRNKQVEKTVRNTDSTFENKSIKNYSVIGLKGLMRFPAVKSYFNKQNIHQKN